MYWVFPDITDIEFFLFLTLGNSGRDHCTNLVDMWGNFSRAYTWEQSSGLWGIIIRSFTVLSDRLPKPRHQFIYAPAVNSSSMLLSVVSLVFSSRCIY